MLFEDVRSIHEDLERLEAAIASRVQDEPRHIRDRLTRDHEIASFLSRIQDQSKRALAIYRDDSGTKQQELQTIGTGESFAEFSRQVQGIREFHKKYPNEPVENLERAYRKRQPGEEGMNGLVGEIDNMFTGEEAFGRFFDLTMLHEEFLNLPGTSTTRRLTYLQYLDQFDAFTPPAFTLSRAEKMTDQYFQYVGRLAEYLESFMRRTKPLEDLDKLFASFDAEFEKEWTEDKVPGWQVEHGQANGGASKGPVTEGTGEGVWCADCEKEFKNDNTYKAHLTGKKHTKAVEARKELGDSSGDVDMTNGSSKPATHTSVQRLKERAVAEREHRIRKLAGAMQTQRTDTRVNVERKAGMTDKERQQELAALYAYNSEVQTTGDAADDDSDSEEKVYNPLKLPLAWDGKPIPFWLYKLHGLGVEFPCEICGNYVYMGRRAFDKHFSEGRHIYGLKCLGITQTGLFREITGIAEAEKLWEKIQRDRGGEKARESEVVQMEDSTGSVMPFAVWRDLEKQGLL